MRPSDERKSEFRGMSYVSKTRGQELPLSPDLLIQTLNFWVSGVLNKQGHQRCHFHFNPCPQAISSLPF
jgi:hypothetical protein